MKSIDLPNEHALVIPDDGLLQVDRHATVPGVRAVVQLQIVAQVLLVFSES